MRASALAYWTERAERFGERAAVNLEHPAGALAEVSAGHRALLLPLLATLLRGDERVVLDLGCGPGRLTAALARTIGGRAVGVDPVAAMLALAPPDPDVTYRPLGADGRLPLHDGEADVVFTCLVLGGILEPADLARTAAEVRRVLAPGGLAFLCESVSDAPDHDHWRPRRAEDYRAAFPWAALTPVAAFADGDDAVTVLAGRATG
jgi:SAM-dependent methyltransferase